MLTSSADHVPLPTPLCTSAPFSAAHAWALPSAYTWVRLGSGPRPALNSLCFDGCSCHPWLVSLSHCNLIGSGRARQQLPPPFPPPHRPMHSCTPIVARNNSPPKNTHLRISGPQHGHDQSVIRCYSAHNPAHIHLITCLPVWAPVQSCAGFGNAIRYPVPATSRGQLDLLIPV